MKPFNRSLLALTGAVILILGLGCKKQLNEGALLAQEEAQAADARVAALEQQLAAIQADKLKAADQATAERVSKAQAKALERQLADLKRSAARKRTSAEALAADASPVNSAPKPVIVEVPEGTPLTVRLEKDLTTATVQPGDSWEGTLAEDIVVAGSTVWRSGAAARGLVTQSIPAGRLSSGQGSLGIKVTMLGGEDIDTPAYVLVGDKRGARNAKFIGGGAALGALIGILSDSDNKGDHALGGAAVGAAAGTATAAATAQTVIKLPAGQAITFTLAASRRVTLHP